MPASSDSSSSVSLRFVGLVNVLSLGQMVILFVLQMVLAKIFGTNAELDAYRAASTIPLVLGGTLSSTVGTVVVTVASGLTATRGESAAESMLARLGLTLVALTTVVALVTAYFSESLVGLLFAEFSSSEAQLTAELLKTLCWLIPLNTLTGFLFGIEHARRRFLLPALSGLLGPAATVVLFVGFTDRSIEAVALSVLLGTVLAVGMLAVRFPRLRSVENGGQRELWRRFGHLSAPLLIGSAYAHLVVFVDRILAAGLPTGSIATLDFAWKIAAAVVTLGTSGLSVIAFPSLAKHAARMDWDMLRTDLNECWRLLAVVVLPMLGGIVVCGYPIISTIYQRGEFTASDSAAVSRLLILYTGAILAAGIGEIAARTFYALGKMWTPTVVGMAGFALGILLKYLLVGRLGVEGLAAATSLYYMMNVITFLILLSWRGLLKPDRRLVTTILRSGAASVFSIGLAAAVMSPESPTRVLLGIVLAVATYVVLMAVLGDEFARRAISFLGRRRNKAR